MSLEALNTQDTEAMAAMDDFLASFHSSGEPSPLSSPASPVIEKPKPVLSVAEMKAAREAARKQREERGPLLDRVALGKALETDREGALKQTEQAIKELFAGKATLDDLETAIAYAEDADVKRILTEELSTKLGPTMTEQILNDPAYRERLKELQTDLNTPLSEGGPTLLKKSSLEKLVAVQEIFGSHTREMIRAFDLGRQDSRLQVSGAKDILTVVYALGKKEGERLMQATTDLNFSNERNDFAGTINRTFSVKSEQTTKGLAEKKYVRHNTFKLGAEYQGDGLAANMLAQSLETYDKINVQEIKTTANIDLGGYVWQGYGFGWDMEEAALGLDIHDPKNEKLANEMLETYIKGRVDKAKDNATKRLKSMGMIDDSGLANHPDLQAVLDSFDTLAERGLAATPQDLARIGADQKNLRFYRQVNEQNTFMTEETWMTAQEFERRRSSGDISAEEAAKIEKNAFHIGKLGMAHEDFVWEGRIDLKKGSPSRGMLEKKLSRSVKK